MGFATNDSIFLLRNPKRLKIKGVNKPGNTFRKFFLVQNL